jgi:hypothetical protein
MVEVVEGLRDLKRRTWPREPAIPRLRRLINWTVPVHSVAPTIVVCRLRTVLDLGRPRKTMACPTAICCPVISWTLH